MQDAVRHSVEGLPQVDSIELGVWVEAVLAGGIGESVGILPGDVIERINSHPVSDPIDYRFHIGEEEVEVHLRRDDEVLILDIEKDSDDDLGITLGDMPILKCNNKCVFCFLHQMPKGLRKTLYYQDDDYRLSFLHGAYVTLTNLSEEEFQRVIDQRLSPMYISVHATDPALRGELLGRSEAVEVMDRIAFLAEHNIQMHAQVVLCPGMNDGEHLKRTVFDLAAQYPHVESVGVVPLGLTRFRKNLPDLSPVTPQVARTCLDQVSEWQSLFKTRLGVNFVYLGDEFYLQSKCDLPLQSHYDGFPLVENGVGMVRRFIDFFEAGYADLKDLKFEPVKVALVTSVLGNAFVGPMSDRLNEVPWLTALPVEVQNTFFGSGITVSGLLTGADILKALKDVPEGLGNVLLPPNCVSHHGLFLDDMTPEELSKTLGCNVFVGTYNLIESILMVANGDPVSHAPVAARTDDHPYISSHQMVEED
jgi:putative radical SAM enzyme (TIGR03279 family)